MYGYRALHERRVQLHEVKKSVWQESMFQDQNNRPKKVMVILVVSYFLAF